MSNTVQLASLSKFSSVDGPGLRTVVWFQGCLHQCEGCHNPQTHDLEGGYRVEISDLLDQIRAIDNKKITLSGGEPFLQKNALEEICITLKMEGYTIWVYTGYEIETLIRDSIHHSILKNIDVLVDGKFMRDLSTGNPLFKGSSNQRIIHLPQFFTHMCVEEAIIR